MRKSAAFGGQTLGGARVVLSATRLLFDAAIAASPPTLTSRLDPMRATHNVDLAALLLLVAAAVGCQSGTSATHYAPASHADAMVPTNGPAVQAASMERAGEYLTIVGG